MQKELRPYYISRAIFSIAFGVLLYFTGSPLWQAILLGGTILGLFLWAPHSGRYSVHPEFGVTAMRRDEWTQAINDKAARNAFVAVMLLIGGAGTYFGALGAALVPAGLLRALLIAGAAVYFGSDVWMRKSQQ